MSYLQAFTDAEKELAKRWLATQVASMMGRKLEEGDWSRVYCLAKNIPDGGWSNLHIDVNYQGLGLEMKLLRIAGLRNRPLKSVCGTTLMHPAATRSIRIEDTSRNATDVMHDVFKQYAELIQERTHRVKEAAPNNTPDMRTGWLIWEDNLTEFLYFEERMLPPNPEQFTAEWNVTPAKGVRKASKSLWIYDKDTRQKRYSVTTSAGIKIQPYFDVPPPSDKNLYYFRVQSEPVNTTTVRLWVSAATAHVLKSKLGSLDYATVSAAILKVVERAGKIVQVPEEEDGLAVAVDISKEAHMQLLAAWEAVSDEHRAQLLLRALA
ncbi:MAG: hypothetical protein H6970_02955 [Gammaproteobacteria bacterium]|nr:hypothetical protein [Bdellovibrionales bacterium]MCP5420064.1 hypothetical protein [Gammaproteobacteria bacterium]MCP5424016.1 hypothetical protein [Gammaproteobacteria bacterium]MCP5459551.1 hypothetical protein [Gammaproteobacteria bacterium]